METLKYNLKLQNNLLVLIKGTISVRHANLSRLNHCLLYSRQIFKNIPLVLAVLRPCLYSVLA